MALTILVTATLHGQGGVQISANTRLEVNVAFPTLAKWDQGSYVPWYDNNHDEPEHPAFTASCAVGKKVRACACAPSLPTSTPRASIM